MSAAAQTRAKPWDGAARSIEAAMRLSSALLVVAGYLGLAATDAHNRTILLVPLLLLAFTPLGEWLDGRTVVYRRLSTAVTLFFGLSLPLLVRVLGLLDAVIVLVIFIQAHKLLHVKRARDYYQTYLMAFFLLVAACAQEAGAGIGLALAFFLVCAVWAFVMRQVQTEAAANESWATADLTDIGVPESLDPLTPRRFIDYNLTASIMGLSLACILLTVLLFLVMPRVEAGLLGGTGTGLRQSSQVRTGLGSAVDVADGGTIIQDYEPVMRVEFPAEPGNRYEGALYFRQTTFDSYWGGRWRRNGVRREPKPGGGSIDFSEMSYTALTRSSLPHTRSVQQRIFLEDVRGAGLPPVYVAARGAALPALSLVRSVSTDGPRLSWSPLWDFTVVAADVSSGVAYEAESEVLEVTPGQLRSAASGYSGVLSPGSMARLTQYDLETRTVDLARQLTRDADTVYDKVAAIEAWLSSGAFVYTLELPALPRANPIDTFIHEVRRGHCQRFATAMAQMVRSLGIPARVVSGYRGGEWFPGERAYIVRRDMAHLWVEVYFAGYGWVTFDPSPPPGWDDPGASGAAARLMRYISRKSLIAKMFWYRNVVGYRGRFSQIRIREIVTAFLPFWDVPESPGGQGLAPAARTLRRGGVLLAAAVLSALALWARARRRRPPHQRSRKGLTPDQKRALRVYQRLKRRLGRYGALCAGRTAGEILREVTHSGLVPADPVHRVVEAYNAARFGGSALSRKDYAGLSRAVRALRRTSPEP